MKSQRPGDFFSLFFDPRVPIAFVSGSIVLAVLGNGVYDLLVEALDTTAYKLWYIVIGSLLIFLFIIFAAWTWLRARRIRSVTIVPPEQEANPHVGLILFPSAGVIEQGNEKPAILNHLKHKTLRHCWMLVSPEATAKSQSLEAFLRKHQVQPHIIPIENAYHARLAYLAVEEALRQATHLHDGVPVIVDITGGPRPMAVGAVLACRDYGVPMEYVLGRYDHGKLDHDACPQIMKVDLSGV